MNNSPNLAERVRFGTFELNVRTGELVSIGTAAAEAGVAKVLLREQPFRILRILVERQGKIVTREEIQQILWPKNTVSRNSTPIGQTAVRWKSRVSRSGGLLRCHIRPF